MDTLTTNENPYNVPKLLTADQVCAVLKISKSTLRNYRKTDDRLRPSLYLARSPRWRSSDISAYLDKLAAERP